MPALTLTEADLRRILTQEERTLLAMVARRQKPREIATTLRCTEEEVHEKVEAMRRRITQARSRLEAPRVPGLPRVIRMRRPSPSAGKRVTLPATLPVGPEEVVVDDPVKDRVEQGDGPGAVAAHLRSELDAASPRTGESFSQRINREAMEEATAIMADFSGLQARARDVTNVLKALGLPLPDGLIILTDEAAPVPQPSEPPAATETPEEPEPDPKPAPAAPAAEKPAEPPAESAPPKPAAQRTAPVGGPAAAKAKGEENYLKVIEYVREHGPTGLRPVWEGLGITQTVVSRHLARAVEEGIIEKTGQMRAARYRFVTTAEVAAELDVKVERKASPEEMAKVRDWVCATKSPFTAQEAIAGTRVPPLAVVDALGQLIQREVVTASGTAEEMLYLYVRPVKPGAAAQADAAARKGAAPSTNGSGGGAPVAGTGGGQLSPNHSVNEIIRAVRAAGGRAAKTSGEHIRITSKDGRSCVIGGTPSNSGLIQDKAKVRKLGIAV